MIDLFFAALKNLLNADQNFASISNNRIKPPMVENCFSNNHGSVNYQIYIQMYRFHP